MRKVSLFTNGSNRAVRIPRDMDFEGVSELVISREGDTIILKPARPSWGSLKDVEQADPEFLVDRNSVIEDKD
ncbi:AbrB/MazE/SpoVT family DNA-binding domain-containing protein [Cronobacter sakazakii]|uniref:type II toxin-antitoxin system VapB family antitoxin n=1 Tax=Cronobacter sakazakii TaxID=28141 RepID=UPI0009BA7075|nr:type II toxin-antitoxin system VapB family antitoxin [Cronobacter sakazakii]MDK1225380.1 type II toxin-antitoxin system VapB family antitoxin [Cronobacter turicensis]EJJ0671767.1 AbrB/MazE/SpoVT family DNA-binding domain-containing protein [Cronobacter sakazakii]EMC4401911.1 AbrB/MazE/SpoVT family DNA-binding domain-containing protein [Cronobacter sakazakii]KAB0805730.1 AbrB/MazE/SpoVT family DNA-binding domain-containing protein [Cronobacter sakazakii]KAB0887701.1 AbrB/MazE/SpoVT family DN